MLIFIRQFFLFVLGDSASEELRSASTQISRHAINMLAFAFLFLKKKLFLSNL